LGGEKINVTDHKRLHQEFCVRHKQSIPGPPPVPRPPGAPPTTAKVKEPTTSSATAVTTSTPPTTTAAPQTGPFRLMQRPPPDIPAPTPRKVQPTPSPPPRVGRPMWTEPIEPDIQITAEDVQRRNQEMRERGSEGTARSVTPVSFDQYFTPPQSDPIQPDPRTLPTPKPDWIRAHETPIESLNQSMTAREVEIRRLHISTLPGYQASRYLERSLYRQIPADGVIANYNIQVGYKVLRPVGEQVYIQVDPVPEDLVSRVPPSQIMHIPTVIFSRLTQRLSECANTNIPPQREDIMPPDTIIFDKYFHMSSFVLRVTIRMVRNHNGCDRYVFLTLGSENQSWFPATLVTFPWFKLTELVAACRSLHLEMVRNNLV